MPVDGDSPHAQPTGAGQSAVSATCSERAEHLHAGGNGKFASTGIATGPKNAPFAARYLRVCAACRMRVGYQMSSAWRAAAPLLNRGALSAFFLATLVTAHPRDAQRPSEFAFPPSTFPLPLHWFVCGQQAGAWLRVVRTSIPTSFVWLVSMQRH